MIGRAKCRTLPNINGQERSSVVELASKNDITVKRSDKGGEIVIIRTQELHSLTLDHLKDTSTYERLKRDLTHSLRIVVNKTLRDVMMKSNFSPGLIHRLQTPPTARTQRFYALPKTHKEMLKIRPIVSSRKGIFDRIGYHFKTTSLTGGSPHREYQRTDKEVGRVPTLNS